MNQLEASGWRGVFTLRRVFVWAFFLSIFCLAVRQCTLVDPDFWWHLKSGEYITQLKAIPHVDPFSFTKGGSDWIAHEWLSEVIMYAIYRLTGWAGLLILFGSIITAAFGVCYWRSDDKPFLAAFTTLLAALASAPLFGMRPQMITLLMVSVFLAILERYKNSGSQRLLWFLPALTVLWVNLHAGFALAPALIMLFIVMSVLDREWNRIKWLVVSLVLCCVVIPLNPNGLRMLSYPFETLSSPSMQALIQEWFSPDFHKFGFLPLAILLLLTFASMALSPRRPRIGELFGLMVLSLAALRSGRHIPLFAVFAAPLLARYSAAWFAANNITILPARHGQTTAIQVILNLALLLLPSYVAVRKIVDFSRHPEVYESQRVPAAAVQFIKTHRVAGPIFNDYNWGGYLIWKLYPDYKVFTDGRADVYGDSFLFDYLNTYRGERGWRDQLNKFGIRTVLIEPHSSLSTLLRDEPGWQVVFEDSQSVVLTKN